MNDSVQKWVDELTAAPSTAIHKLVLGYAGVSAWSRSSLRESFVEIFQTHANALDTAVAAWLRERLMTPPPERTPTLVWASHLQDLFSALAGLPLPQVARLLRDRLRDFRSWLRPLRTDESLDPEAAYFAALAWAHTNQHLEGLWQRMALRRDGEPAYYTDIGLLGLRKTRDDRGKLPSKAPFLLLATLVDLADTGLSQDEWLLTTRALLGGYHCSLETWVREFEPVLEARRNAKRGPEWLREVLPSVKRTARVPHGVLPEEPIPLRESNAMVREVERRGLNAQGLVSFLNRHRAYANATRESHYIVRTFNRLAEAARKHDPDWAIKRAEEALAWDENNAKNWDVLAHCLWAKGHNAKDRGDNAEARAFCREAIDILWEARFRFPSDDYPRNELAKFLRAAGDLSTAEAVGREAIAESPTNAWCFLGLAETLLCLHDKTQGERERKEAESLFLRAADLGNDRAKLRLRAMKQRFRRELESQLFPESGDAQPVEDERSVESVAIPQPSVSEMRPAQRLGRALLLQWQASHTESAAERKRRFAEAEALLTLPDELTGECRTAFIEARGYLLLARNQAMEARAYFEQQLAAFTPSPLGLRLGFAEARARLGETLSDAEEAELASFGPEGSVLPLVLKAVRLLESTASDDGLRDLLIELYPRVRDLARMPASELGEESESAKPNGPVHQPKTPDTMMAQFLLARVFSDAAIRTSDDLQANGSIPRVRASLKAHRDDIFSVAEKLALTA